MWVLYTNPATFLFEIVSSYTYIYTYTDIENKHTQFKISL